MSIVVEIEKLSKDYWTSSSPLKRMVSMVKGRPEVAGDSKVQKRVLNGVNLSVHSGESIGILGRNGSGKSTLLHLIAGTLQPSAGRVRVKGKIGALLELGAGFNPDFTGEENVRLSASIHGLSSGEVDQQILDIMRFADIGDYFFMPVKSYSSGMVVRLAFAVNTILKPDILLIDEALAVGDILFQQKCFKFMQEDLGSTTKILVTHDLRAVSSTVKRVLVMEQGRLVFDGPTLEGVEYYLKTVQNDNEDRDASTNKDRGDSPWVKVDEPEGLPWIDIDRESASGAKEAVIAKVSLTDKHGGAVRLVKPGERLLLDLVFSVNRTPIDLIFGYLVSDRFGKHVCGDNSYVINGVAEINTRGTYHVHMAMDWPYVKDDDYTVTVGIGEGAHSTKHKIQCWAQNCFTVSSVCFEREIVGAFSNPLVDFKIRTGKM